MSVVIQSGFLGNVEVIDNARICFDAHAATGTASGTASGASAAWVTDGETWTVWEGSGASVSLTITFASNLTTGYAALAAHNLGSASKSVALHTSTDGTNFSAHTGISTHAPDDDGAIVWLFANTSLRAVRFVFSGGSTAPQVAVAQAGEVLEFPRLSTFTGLPISESAQVRYRHQQSVTGDVLGRAVEGADLNFTLQIDYLPETFRTAAGDITWSGFKAHLEATGPFFVMSKPSSYPDDVAYARCVEHPRFERTMPNAAASGSVTLSCMGYRPA